MDWREYIPELNGEQLKGFSDLLRDIAQISLASVAIPFLIPEFSPDKMPIVISGSVVALFCWYQSIKILKNTQNHE